MTGVISKKYKYDPVYGEWVREVRSSSVVNIGTSASTTTAAGATLASTTTDANTELWVTNLSFGAASDELYYVLNGSSTIMSTQGEAKKQITYIGSKESPLFIVPASTSISLIVEGAATSVTANMSALKMPIVSKLETA